MTRTCPAIPIEAKLGVDLHWVLAAVSIAEEEDRLSTMFGSLLAALGVPGSATVTLQAAESKRALRVLVHGKVQPFTPVLMKRVWLAIAPAALRDVPVTADARGERAFPDGWLRSWVSAVAATGDSHGLGVLVQYLQRLLVEIVLARPSCLIGPAQVAAVRSSADGDLPDAAPGPYGALAFVVRFLLDLGVRQLDLRSVLVALEDAKSTSFPAAYAAEAVYDRRPPTTIELQASTETLADLLPGVVLRTPASVQSQSLPEYVRDAFRKKAESFHLERGVLLPDIVLVPTKWLKRGMFAVQVGDWPELPIPSVSARDLAVMRNPDEVRKARIKCKAWTHPLTGRSFAVIDAVRRQDAEDAGFEVFDPFEFVTDIVVGEAGRLAPRLVTMSYVEQALALLAIRLPELVHAATFGLPLEETTMVIRMLVDEAVPIVDLRRVLERLLAFGTITIDSDLWLVLDDRLPVSGEAHGPAEESLRRAEHVRQGLAAAITQRYAGRDDTVRAYVLDAAIEEAAVKVDRNALVQRGNRALPPLYAEALADAVWRVQPSKQPDEVETVAVLTGEARPVIRAALRGELPELPVIARAELRPGVNVFPVARLKVKSATVRPATPESPPRELLVPRQRRRGSAPR